MRNIADIAASVRRGERIDAEDALVLWRDAPLWLLGELATERKRAASGEQVFYNRNVHLEPSNICLFNCEFCSFRRREGDADAWYMSLDEIEARARELRGSDITEVHIVGGVHPKHDLDTYCAMIRRVKRALPDVAVKAYTAVEIFYMIRREGISVVEGLRRLVDAGMEAIPGGGAEIFDAELRMKICPDKCSAEEWLAVHRAAHNMGISTNCTMLYGHVETLEQRIDHLERLRALQDDAPGFDAFIPLKYRSRNNRMSAVGECSVEEDMRMIAMSRIYLDNIPHIKAYWVAYGKPTTEMALAFGADDIDGTIEDSTKIYSMAGADERPRMSVEELEALVRSAGFEPVERDTHYRVVERTARGQRVAAVAKERGGNTEMAKEAAKEAEKEPKAEIDMSVKAEPQSEEPATEIDATKADEVAAEAQKRESVENKMKRLYEEPAPKAEAQSKGRTSGATAHKSQGDKKGGRRAGENSSKSGEVAMWRRHPLLANMLMILLLGIALLVLLYVGLMSGTRHGESIVVPDFRGMNIDEARALADEESLNVVVRDSIFDVYLPGGTVVDQLPRTSDVRDVTVKPGRKIYLTINAYSRRMVDVPYVAKQTLRQALNQLERVGLTVSKLVYEPDMTSTDYVLRQEVDGREVQPSTQQRVPVGTGVTLYVSYRREEQYTVVPRLIGLSYAQAKSTVWDSGLNVGKVSYDDSVEDIVMARKARVYRQSLHQSSGASRGAEITLHLSCDEHLVDSLRKVSDAEAKRHEEQRRKEEQQRRTALAAEDTVDAENL